MPTSQEDWEKDVLRPAIEKTPERASKFETPSAIPIKRIYVPEDLEDLDYEQDLGYPGQFPFTRGVQPTMYRGRFWTMRQYAGYGTAEQSNRRYRYLLSQGQTGLSVAFDLPTQMGYDSDHHLAEGEVGKVGVAISSIDDMEILTADIPLDQVSTSMTINATASILLAMYIASGPQARHRREETKWHRAKRHSEGIHCTRHIYLSHRALYAPHRRHNHVLR